MKVQFLSRGLTIFYTCIAIIWSLSLSAKPQPETIRDRAQRELDTSLEKSSSSENWMNHAATINPIEHTKERVKPGRIYELSMALETFSPQGTTAMKELPEFSLSHYAGAPLLSLKVIAQPSESTWQNLYLAPIGEFAFSQNDSDLPLTSSSQGGAIRLHHFFLEGGYALTWKTQDSNWSYDAALSFGQYTLIQSSVLSQARYSVDEWYSAFTTGVNYQIRSNWQAGLQLRTRQFFAESANIQSVGGQFGLRLNWRM